MPGNIPIRAKGQGLVPAPGWTGEYEWTGYIPFDELPFVYNPPTHYIVTANNKVVPDSYPYFISAEWSEPSRAQRISDLLRDLWGALGCIGELLGYLLRFVSVFFQSRASLAARLLAAESQLAVCKRRMEQREHPRPKLTAGFRFLWVVLSKLWAPWQVAAQLMQPATVKAWHTRAFRL
jgi:hypothetical protein